VLAKTDYILTIDQEIERFVEDYFSEETEETKAHKNVSAEEVVKGVLPEVKEALKRANTLELLVWQRTDKYLKLRTGMWFANESGQQDLFGFQRMFIRYPDKKRGPMGRADYDVVMDYRERELKNMRKVHNAFEKREQVFDVILPIMKERKEQDPNFTVADAITEAQEKGKLL
jgi:hypothetical protein